MKNLLISIDKAARPFYLIGEELSKKMAMSTSNVIKLGGTSDMGNQEFKNNFRNLVVPEALQELLIFQKGIPEGEFYSAHFWLDRIDYQEDSVLANWSDEEGFFLSLLEFADSDDLGGTYAFWLVGRNKDLSQAPIVYMGGDGDAGVVAENLQDFLRLLSIDVMPIAFEDRICYFRDEDEYEKGLYRSEHIDTYKTWLKEVWQLQPVVDEDGASQITDQAEERYGEDFREWLSSYSGCCF